MTSSPFDVLTDDPLLELFLRCPAETHGKLILTCKRFRDLLLSAKFRRGRAVTEWAQVCARLVTPEESFNSALQEDDESTASNSSFFRDNYNDLGYIGEYPGAVVVQCQVDFMVDGKKAGEASFCLVKRKNTRHFHEACDAISGDLKVTGCTFFDTKGRPRVASIRDALDGDNNDLLYISKVKWNPEYRRCSFVGAQALRSFLTDPKLQDKWAVAIYIPESNEQYTKDDEALSYEARELRRPSSKSQEEYAKLKAWEKRCEELTNIDMRQFLRAGFLQVQETARTSDCKYAFAVPAFLNSPILSADETKAIEILEKPTSDIQAPTGANHDFLEFIMESCAKRNNLRKQIESQGGPLPEAQMNQMLNSLFETQIGPSLRENRQKINQNLSQARDLVSKLEEIISKVDEAEELDATGDERGRELKEEVDKCLASSQLSKEDLETHLQTARDMLSQSEEIERTMGRSLEEQKAQMLEQVRQGMQEQSVNTRKEMESLDSKVREEIARFLSVGATVQGSFVLHACAANRTTEYIDMLLETVPSSEVRDAINGFDQHGSTPLMVAAGVTQESGKDLVDTVEKLFSLGADKNIVNASGESALGQFRQVNRSMKDFRNTFGLGGNEASSVDSQIEALLLPSGGATLADEAYLDPPLSEGIDEFMLEDDDENEDDVDGEEEEEE